LLLSRVQGHLSENKLVKFVLETGERTIEKGGNNGKKRKIRKCANKKRILEKRNKVKRGGKREAILSRQTLELTNGRQRGKGGKTINITERQRKGVKCRLISWKKRRRMERKKEMCACRRLLMTGGWDPNTYYNDRKRTKSRRCKKKEAPRRLGGPSPNMKRRPTRGGRDEHRGGGRAIGKY